MGQGGNVFEWEETDFDLVNGPTTDARGVRGGYWSSGCPQLGVDESGQLRPGESAELHWFSRCNVVPEPDALRIAGDGRLGTDVAETHARNWLPSKRALNLTLDATVSSRAVPQPVVAYLEWVTSRFVSRRYVRS